MCARVDAVLVEKLFRWSTMQKMWKGLRNESLRFIRDLNYTTTTASKGQRMFYLWSMMYL